jgi:hypothetical protein
MMIVGSSTWLEGHGNVCSTMIIILFKLTPLIEENKILILGQVY